MNLKVCVCCIPIGIYTHKKLQLNRNQITFTQPFPIGTCIGCPRDLDQSEHHESRSYGRCKSVRVEKMGRSSSIGSNIIFNRFHPHRFFFVFISLKFVLWEMCITLYSSFLNLPQVQNTRTKYLEGSKCLLTLLDPP